MSAPYDPGQPRWDPAMEVFPGGPHPGAVAQMHAEAAAREQQARAVAESRRIAEQRVANHLLLLR